MICIWICANIYIYMQIYVYVIYDFSLVKRQISCRWLRRMRTATFEASWLLSAVASRSSVSVRVLLGRNPICCSWWVVTVLSSSFASRSIRGINAKHCQPCWGGAAGRWTRRAMIHQPFQVPKILVLTKSVMTILITLTRLGRVRLGILFSGAESEVWSHQF